MSLTLLISVTTIIYMYMLSCQLKAGLWLGLVAQLLWLIYIYKNEAWGLIPLNGALWWVYLSGLKNWTVRK